MSPKLTLSHNKRQIKPFRTGTEKNTIYRKEHVRFLEVTYYLNHIIILVARWLLSISKYYGVENWAEKQNDFQFPKRKKNGTLAISCIFFFSLGLTKNDIPCQTLLPF